MSDKDFDLFIIEVNLLLVLEFYPFHYFLSYCIFNLSRPTTPANITSGCRVAGLVPFNRFIFDGDVDFAPSFVTDRPFRPNSSPVPSS